MWSSELATAVRAWTGLPVAAWGLVWALAVGGQALWLTQRRLRDAATETLEHSLRLSALAGLVAAVMLAIASVAAGALCPTCLATYALTAAITFVALRWLPSPLVPTSPVARRAAGIAVVAAAMPFVLASGAAALSSSLARGASEQHELALPAAGQPSSSSSSIAELLAELDPPTLQAVADSLAIHRASRLVNTAPYPVRHLVGPADAPVRVIEWTDVRCGHCRRLLEVIAWLRQLVPMERWALEQRHFPLDATCNPYIGQPDPSGVRCLAARVQICLEPTPEFEALRAQLFAEQDTLTAERVRQIGSSGSVSRQALDRCIEAADTTQRLVEDVHYAGEYRPDGTPVVAINGRKATSIPAFLLLMVLLEGRLDHPALAALPPSNPNAHIH